MHRAVGLRRLTRTVGLTTAVTGGALAAAACSPAVPTATLNGGTVTVTGSAARDLIAVTMNANELAVNFGSDSTIDARFPRAQIQRVQVQANEGDDAVTVSGAGVGDVPLTVSGSIGSDAVTVFGNVGDRGAGDAAISINGDDGNDNLVAIVPGPVTVQAGAGDDTVRGGGAGVGQETIFLGAGNDRFVSSLESQLGARNDIVEGNGGRDTMEVDGSVTSETLTLSTGNAGHLIIDRDDSFDDDDQDRIDADNVEDVKWFGFGGLPDGAGDTIIVNDLLATDVFEFTPDFSSGRGSNAPNNSSDTLIMRGTPDIDFFAVGVFRPNTISVGGTVAMTAVFLQPDDLLRIETLEGNDIVDSASLPAGLVQFEVF
jgi:hypothetical protein